MLRDGGELEEKKGAIERSRPLGMQCARQWEGYGQVKGVCREAESEERQRRRSGLTSRNHLIICTVRLLPGTAGRDSWR